MNQHDETRKILELIRENSKKPMLGKTLIKEQTGPTINVQQEDQNALDPTEMKEQERLFRDTVTQRVKFNKMKLYPKAQNVEWSGEFTDNAVEWFYSLDDTQGVYVTTELLQLREDTMKLLQKLIAYYKTWSDDWAKRIAEEYENQQTDEENAEEGPDSMNSPGFGEEGEGESMPNPTEENA